MDVKMLQDYSNWVGKTPKEIISAVKGAGGWKNVFPDSLPVWAHRVRNFFNVEPKSLWRFDEDTSKNFIGRVQEGLNALKTSSLKSDIAETFALSGDVYKDAQNKIWYQMSPGGTIYHWGRNPIAPMVESPWQSVKGQGALPIFKLIAPDGTGGSHETILRNPHHISTVVKKENFLAYVAHLVLTDYWHQGSYNYSETVDAGYSAHVMRDVDPHTKYPFPEIYVNPPDRFAARGMRVFPEKVSNDGVPLAKQI